MKRFVIAALVVTLGLASSATAFAQGTGRSLDIQPSGRENGLGAAGVALAEGPSGCTWWNPAGLGFATKAGVDLTYAQLVPGLADDVLFNYGSYVQPIKGFGAFGLAMTFLSYGESEGFDNSGTSTGVFSSYEFAPALYYGTRVLPDLSIGAGLKYIRIQLAPDSQQGTGSTFAVDLGALYRIPAARLSLGVAIQNMGPSVTFINEDDSSPLSRAVRTGLSWQAVESGNLGVLIVGDYYQSLVTNEFRTYNGGIEVSLSDQIAGRVGYYEDPLGDISGLTFGLGVAWKGLTLDYGSIPQAQDSGLENVQKFTLGYRF